MSHAPHANDFHTRNTFDRASGKRVFEVGVKCRACPREAWAPAKNPGWGRRIFKEAGWSLGNRLNQHTCPDCVVRKRKAAERQSATIHELFPADAAQPCPDIPPKLEPLPELPPIPRIPLEDLPALPEIPRPPRTSIPTAIEEEPMAQTALAEALRPLQQDNDRKRHIRDARGTPHGFVNESSARTAAWRTLRAAGIKGRIVADKHYRLEKAADGTISYVLLNAADDTPARKPGRRLMAKEGRPLAARVSAVNQAEIVCERLGIAKPIEGIHFSVSGSPGQGWVYKILPAAEVAPDLVSKGDCMTRDVAPPRVCGGGFLSRFDAKKDALGVLQAARKSGGVPLEGVDYWITQDGFNLWGWNTQGPAPAKPEFPVNVVPPAPAMVDLQQVNGCQVVASYGNAPKPPVSIGKPDEPRKPTPRDNRRIMEALDEHYSVDRQSYFASFSDAVVAQRLDVPRAWVSKVREEFYGPERNAEVEVAQKLARLDEAIGKASGALTKGQAVIDTLAELETLVAELRKLRAEIAR